jgi:hypothetical protein
MNQQARKFSLLLAVATLTAQAPIQEARRTLREIPAPPTHVAQRGAALSARLRPSVRLWVEDQARRQRGLPTPDLESIRSAARVRFALPPGPGIAPVAPPMRSATGKVAAAPQPQALAPPSASSSLGTGDIEALVFLVLMQCTQDAEADLRSTMEEVKKQNDQKARLRGLLDEVRQASPGSHPATAPCAEPICGTASERLRELTLHLPAKARLAPRSLTTYGDLARLEADAKNSLDSLSDLSEMTSLRLQMEMDRREKALETLSNLMKKMSDTAESIIGNLK